MFQRGLSRLIAVLLPQATLKTSPQISSGFDYAKLSISWRKQVEGMVRQCVWVFILTCIVVLNSKY